MCPIAWHSFIKACPPSRQPDIPSLRPFEPHVFADRPAILPCFLHMSRGSPCKRLIHGCVSLVYVPMMRLCCLFGRGGTPTPVASAIASQYAPGDLRCPSPLKSRLIPPQTSRRPPMASQTSQSHHRLSHILTSPACSPWGWHS